MVSVHSTVQNFTVNDWNRLAGDNPFACHGWLSTAESCSRAAAKPLYFALRRGDDLCAAAVCYTARTNPEVETLDDLLLGRLRRAANRVGFSFLPSLVCGPAQGYGWHIGIDPRIDASEHDAIRGKILDGIEAEADRRRLTVSFVQVLDDENALRATLQARGYQFSENVPIAWMDIRWPSIEAYFGHLPGKRRRECRRESRRNIKDGTQIEILRSCQGIEDRLFSLLEANVRRHAALGFPFNGDLLSALMRNMGANATVFVARKHERISGVQLILRRGETAVAFAVAVDEEISGNDFTYFQLGYYHLIEYAIEHDIKRIYFGRGMYEPKIRRGCRLAGSGIYTRSQGAQRLKTAAWLPIASWWNRRKQDG